MVSPLSSEELTNLIADLVHSPPDVTFVFVGEKGEDIGLLRAHKQILSHRSPYFDQLFQDSMRPEVIRMKPEHRRSMKALIAQVYNSCDLHEILDQLDLPDILCLGSLGEEYQLLGVRQAAEERLSSFSLPPIEKAVLAAASEAEKYPLLGENLIKALHKNCAKTLSMCVRTDKQVKDFLRRHQGTEFEQFSLEMKDLMDQIIRDGEDREQKEGFVMVTREYLKKVQREKQEEEKRENQKLEKEEKLKMSRRKREKRKEREIVVTTRGVKGDEYNMEAVLAALGEVEDKQKKKLRKHSRASNADSPEKTASRSPPAADEKLSSPKWRLEDVDDENTEENEEESPAVKIVDQELKVPRSPWIATQSISTEPELVVKEMYEPAVPEESKQTTMRGLNLNAKEFIPRYAPVASSPFFIAPKQVSPPPSMVLGTDQQNPPYHDQEPPPVISLPILQKRQTFSNCTPSNVNRAIRASQCCNIGANKHMGVSQQFALSATTKYRRPEDISVPSRPLYEAYGDLVHVRHNRSVSNLTGIAPLLPIPTQELAGELPKVNWDDQLHTLPQGAGLPPPPHHQPQYPLQDHQPLCPPTDCQPQKNQWEPFCSDQGNDGEEMQSSMSQSLSPESPEISFLQPSFLSPTYQRPKNVAHGF